MSPGHDRAQLAMEDVSKAYGDRTVLDRVSLTVRPGDRVGVIGGNGSRSWKRRWRRTGALSWWSRTTGATAAASPATGSNSARVRRPGAPDRPAAHVPGWFRVRTNCAASCSVSRSSALRPDRMWKKGGPIRSAVACSSERAVPLDFRAA